MLPTPIADALVELVGTTCVARHPRYPPPMTLPANSRSTNTLYCCARVDLKSVGTACSEPLRLLGSIAVGTGKPSERLAVGRPPEDPSLVMANTWMNGG